MRISAHEPFFDTQNAIKNNADIVSDIVVFEHAASRIKVKDTDGGRAISERIADLKILLRAFEVGKIKENTVR